MPPAAVAPVQAPLRAGATTPLTRFGRNPAVRASVAVLAVVVLAAVVGPVFMPTAYGYPTTLQLAPPSA